MIPSYAALKSVGLADSKIESVRRFHMGPANVACSCKVVHVLAPQEEIPQELPIQLVRLNAVQDGPFRWMIGKCPECGTGFYSGPYWEGLDD